MKLKDILNKEVSRNRPKLYEYFNIILDKLSIFDKSPIESIFLIFSNLPHRSSFIISIKYKLSTFNSKSSFDFKIVKK